MTTMFITGINKGADSFSEFRGRILYAVVKDNSDRLVCSATLEFILRTYFDEQTKIANYKEALIRYLDFNNRMTKFVS